VSDARAAIAPTRIGGHLFEWGSRTFVMGIVNVTPDSFSGDGLLATVAGHRGAAMEAAVAQARRMADEGADIVDVGGNPIETLEALRAIPGLAEDVKTVVDAEIADLNGAGAR